MEITADRGLLFQDGIITAGTGSGGKRGESTLSIHDGIWIYAASHYYFSRFEFCEDAGGRSDFVAKRSWGYLHRLDVAAVPGAEQLAFGSPVAISNLHRKLRPITPVYLERLTASGKTFNVPVNIHGNLTVTGTCTGCGGGGSGTVNSGTAAQVAMYAANGAAVSGDSALTDSGSTLTYTGSNGITAASGAFRRECKR